MAKVVDALVAQLNAHLDEHVASGKNTQAEADQMLADARSRIEAFVNGTAPAGGPGFGFGGPGGRGHHGFGFGGPGGRGHHGPGFGGPGGRGHHGPGFGGPGAPAPSSSGSTSGTTTS